MWPAGQKNFTAIAMTVVKYYNNVSSGNNRCLTPQFDRHKEELFKSQTKIKEYFITADQMQLYLSGCIERSPNSPRGYARTK